MPLLFSVTTIRDPAFRDGIIKATETDFSYRPPTPQ